MITDANLGESENIIMCDNAVLRHDSANQGLDTPESDPLVPSSVLSDPPPDIKNWFSSYEYESFVLETNDNFGFSDPQETQQSYGKECNTENILKPVEDSTELISNEKNEDIKYVNQVLDSPLLSSEPPPGIENWFCSYAYESPAPDHTIILSHQKDSMVDKDEPCNGNDGRDENLHVFDDEKLVECDNGSSCRRRDHENEEVEANGDSLSKHGEEEGNGNGFVSVKSKREKDDKSMYGNKLNGKRSSSSSSCGVGKMKEENERRRKILGDMTNIEPGKWKCPRKSKPDIGPPLKQLQLGQWFHRQ
ncbi:unnamed protein product [Lactuca virosa]|uniref:Uncharacterized protein n=1 Tax=Lactuca virosa TaxID=75947 RepID=A0AAU9M2L3_9ASTR|nr:unnamed protein product [Lactuca virosa]